MISLRAEFLKLCHCYLALTSLLFELHTHALDAIYPGQSLSGNQTLLSENKTFELGYFFSPGEPSPSGTYYYIGIWYTNTISVVSNKKTVVWVANRENPVFYPSSCELKLQKNGDFVLFDKSKGAQIWSTGSASSAVNSTVVLLLDNGNLIVRDSSSPNVVLWQSFDYPTDHWLPGGKLGYNRLKKSEQSLISWRSPDLPSPGLFSLEVQHNGMSHLLLWNHTKQYWSSGVWNGKFFNSVSEININSYVKNLTYVSNENETYFTYEQAVPGALTRFVIDATGQLKQCVWGLNFTGWSLYWTSPPQQCDVYAFCGPFSSCNRMEMPLCRCLPGFEPVVPKDWDLGDHTDGCQRKNNNSLCDESDEFIIMKKMRYSVDDDAVITTTTSEVSNCRLACVVNCTCNAYAYDDEGRKCSRWIGRLYNILQLPSDDTTGKEIYIRVSASDAANRTTRSGGSNKSRRFTLWIVLGTVFGSLITFVIVVVFACNRLGKKTSDESMEDSSLTVFKLRDLRIATKNFSEKLGEGGFGSVFKGTLSNSSEVVGVKRLKINMEDAVQEKQFRAEVSTIGMIQHVNLVRLRGFCVQDSERFLVYDFMTNGSLASKLFENHHPLDWRTRYKIATGIARGLAYLHEECRDCIIHLDIKPENILLDQELNPKVADFGLAKLVGREFSRVLTTVRGTRGYLAPEWISGEPITAKADVFSYGMLLFEMVSGHRNGARLSDDVNKSYYFPAAVAQRIIKTGEEVASLLDERLRGGREEEEEKEAEADDEEVYRVCKVACWCIQDDDKDRPSMGRVVQVLEGVLDVDVDVCLISVPRFLQGFMDGDEEPIVFLLEEEETVHSSSASSSTNTLL